MPASIDRRKAHASRPYGDLIVLFSWFDEQRALFIIPRFRENATWFVVLEPAAHEWDDRDPTSIANIAARSAKACEQLGITPTPKNARRIVSIVNDSMVELLRMPSAPPTEYKPGSIGSMILREDGRPIAGEPIRLEDAGATYGQ